LILQKSFKQIENLGQAVRRAAGTAWDFLSVTPWMIFRFWLVFRANIFLDIASFDYFCMLIQPLGHAVATATFCRDGCNCLFCQMN
jgi:hypothetical protein